MKPAKKSETLIRVRGGNKLEGTVTPVVNKNSFVAALPAAILTNQDIRYKQVPSTLDIEKILKILELLGARITRHKNQDVTINCAEVHSFVVDPELGGAFRASLMFAGPLLARFGKAVIPMSGGCTLGFRGIEAHVDVFRQVGVKIERGNNIVTLTAPKRKRSSYTINPLEVSVTATENLLMYTAGTDSTVKITDAACEPHVVDLSVLLRDMGATIDGMGSNRLTVTGNAALSGATFFARPDFVDIAGYIVAAAITNGTIRITGANIPEMIDSMLHWFELFGIEIKRDKKDLVVSRKRQQLKINGERVFPLAAPDMPKLAPRPWPGFPVDVIPVMATLACKTHGKLLLQNWMYEDGLQFVRELNDMGADIYIAGPQRIIIRGPITFTGGNVNPPRVIESTKAVLFAALCDPGETIIRDSGNVLSRRYQNIFTTYRKLGADITIIDA